MTNFERIWYMMVGDLQGVRLDAYSDKFNVCRYYIEVKGFVLSLTYVHGRNSMCGDMSSLSYVFKEELSPVGCCREIMNYIGLPLREGL